MADMEKATQELNTNILNHTAQIVAAHVGHNAMPPSEIPEFIREVHSALTSAGAPEPVEEKPEPAVPIRRSITPDYLICLEDGKKLKMLKRHLQTSYNMTPEEYRAKWGLPADYPMVAPNYAKQRSELAKQIGLGRGGRKAAAAPAKQTSGRKRKQQA